MTTKKITTKKQDSFIDYIESCLTKKDLDRLYLKFGTSKKWVTMRLKNPKKLTGSEVYILMEITGKTFDDLKPFII